MTSAATRARDWLERHFTFTLVLGGLVAGLSIVTAVLALVVFPRIDAAEERSRADDQARISAQQAQAAADDALRRVVVANRDFCQLAGQIGVELRGVGDLPTTTAAGERFGNSLENIGMAADRAAQSPACPAKNGRPPGLP